MISGTNSAYPAVGLFSPPGIMLNGAGSTAGNTATAVIPAQGAGSRIYVTSLQFGNSSGSTVVVSLNDTAGSNFIVPAGGGNNPPLEVPLVMPVNTALTFAPNLAVTTTFCNAQGYIGT
jgi:hypothetical protein